MVLTWSILLACARNGAAPAPAPAPAPTVAERFGDWPFLVPVDAPSTVALVGGGEVSTHAATCGGCHVDHYAEWRQATHASAIHDLQLLAELAKPGQPRWLCLNCHAPTAPQRAEAITPATPLAAPGSVVALAAAPNPAFDPSRTAEGVTCAACHVRRDADGQGTVVGPRGSGRAPHRVRHDPAALGGVCVQCHSPGPATLTPTFTCWFETADEVAAGPTPDAACTDCHMPETTRPAAVGGPPVALRRHAWTGGGVPKHPSGYAGLLDRGWRPAVDVTLSVAPPTVTLVNARAAHLVPTADPERHLRVEARTLAADGAVLGRAVLRIGQTWDWGDEATARPARRLADDRLAPGVPRAWTPPLPTAGAVRFEVEVAHVRLSPDNARYAAGATLDAELRALWPEAAALLPAIDRHYPLATLIWRGSMPLAGGPTEQADLATLLAESAALVERPLAEKAARLAGP